MTVFLRKTEQAPTPSSTAFLCKTFGYPRHAPFRLTAGDGRNTKVPAQDSFRGTVLQSELKLLVPSNWLALPLFICLQSHLNGSFGSMDREVL
jgi:hypothetical protein